MRHWRVTTVRLTSCEQVVREGEEGREVRKGVGGGEGGREGGEREGRGRGREGGEGWERSKLQCC